MIAITSFVRTFPKNVRVLQKIFSLTYFVYVVKEKHCVRLFEPLFAQLSFPLTCPNVFDIQMKVNIYTTVTTH